MRGRVGTLAVAFAPLRPLICAQVGVNDDVGTLAVAFAPLRPVEHLPPATFMQA